MRPRSPIKDHFGRSVGRSVTETFKMHKISSFLSPLMPYHIHFHCCSFIHLKRSFISSLSVRGTYWPQLGLVKLILHPLSECLTSLLHSRLWASTHNLVLGNCIIGRTQHCCMNLWCKIMRMASVLYQFGKRNYLCNRVLTCFFLVDFSLKVLFSFFVFFSFLYSNLFFSL